MNRTLIAVTAALATAALLAPVVASACSLVDPSRITDVIADDTPDCLSVLGGEAPTWEPYAALDVVNDCAVPVVIRCPEDADCTSFAFTDGEAELVAGASGRLFVPSGGATLGWDDGSARGEIVYTTFDRELTEAQASACDTPFGCNAAVGATSPAGLGWLTLALVGLIGLRRRSARG